MHRRAGGHPAQLFDLVEDEFAVGLPLLINLLHLLGETLQVIGAGAVVDLRRVDLVAQFGNLLLQRGGFFGLQFLRGLHVLDHAEQFVDLLLRAGVLRAEIGNGGGDQQK